MTAMDVTTVNSPMPSPEALDWAHPLVAQWFRARFGTPTEPQIAGWPHILAGETTLIAAPTGSGKTLAAFLVCIDKLVRKALDGKLSNHTEVIYVSPLKALSNDVEKNLQVPLKEIFDLAMENNLLMPEIRTMVRTGDTLAIERRTMLKRPPHILVTTPESLYIMVTAEKSRAILREVETVIVDEIHALADDKRGVHLSLSLERLESLTWKPPNRVGLSATQKPIELTAQFLAGNGRDLPHVVDVGHRRQLDIAVEIPESPLGAVATNELWGEIYEKLLKLIKEHTSTLIFVNTRKLAERLAHKLGEMINEENGDKSGESLVLAHHGSLSRELRLEAEKRLKAGELKALVATASLELGIDVGAIDLVCQISSPRNIAVALQRIGRAGHWRGAIPKGRLFATTRDDLLECAALIKSINEGDLDRLLIPKTSLDVLCQQIIAACATRDWREDDLFDLVKRAYPYSELQRSEFENVLQMLASGLSDVRARYGAFLIRDRVNGMVKARRGSLLAAVTNAGAIPETAMFTVLTEPDGLMVGTLDEDFAVESSAGDVMLLGTTSWKITKIEGKAGRVWVVDANGAQPSVPFWRGEAPGRSKELSEQLSGLREEISRLALSSDEEDFDNAESDCHESDLAKTTGIPRYGAARAESWLVDNCGLSKFAAFQAVSYVLEGQAILGGIPSRKLVIAERFFDEAGGMQLVIHSPFGSRINKAWGMALTKKFCRNFDLELQAQATENGINISLSERHSFPLADVFQFLSTETVVNVLEQAILQSPLFTTRFRWAANRSLALLRYQGGKKVPPQIQRMRAEDLLTAVFPQAASCQDNIVGEIAIPDHPLIKETMKDALTEALDVDGFIELLRDLKEGAIATHAIDTPSPSVFSHEILNANPYAYLDDAPLEERRARAVELRRVLPDSIASTAGRLDEYAIGQVQMEAWPDIRNEDDLHDFLYTVIAAPPHLSMIIRDGGMINWSIHFRSLLNQRRAGVATIDGNDFWVATERKNAFLAIYPDANFEDHLPDIDDKTYSREEAVDLMMRGWMCYLGPVKASVLSELLGLQQFDVDVSLLKVEAQGSIMRGKFTGLEEEWCDRRLLARIHRLTVDGLRRQIRPVTREEFMLFLTRWQHVAPGTQLVGVRGLQQILNQLQGFELPANAWETQILPKRIRKFTSADLDQLCMTGTIGWGRISPHPATVLPVDPAPRKFVFQRPRYGMPIVRTLADKESADHSPKLDPALSVSIVSDRDERTRPLSLVSDTNLAKEIAGRRVIPSSVSPMTFFIRQECDWISYCRRSAENVDQYCLSTNARLVFKQLRQRGALFFADLTRFTGLLKAEVEMALWELVAAGLATADGFDNLRSLIDPKRRSGQGSARDSRPRNAAGRWSILGELTSDEEVNAVESACMMLLNRYGVLFKDLLTRETTVPTWREMLPILRRKEARGEIRGGRFVSGFSGEQFALPEALESLRANRDQPTDALKSIEVSSVDPLNLRGIILPGEKVSASSGRFLNLGDDSTPSFVREDAEVDYQVIRAT
jgi:ATP-dependent Lhr-like helicase